MSCKMNLKWWMKADISARDDDCLQSDLKDKSGDIFLFLYCQYFLLKDQNQQRIAPTKYCLCIQVPLLTKNF